jgi:hypothetical protein
MKDYLPKDDHGLLDFAKSFTRELFPMLSRLNFPEARYQRLATLRNDFEQKLEIASNDNTRTKITIYEKNLAHDDLEHAIRNDTQEFIMHNSACTDHDREVLGLPIHDTKPTPVPVPTSRVSVYKVELSGPGEITFHLRDDQDEKSFAKPPGTHGAEECWAFSDVPITDWSLLTNSVFTTKTTFKQSFTSAQRKLTLYFAFRWENTRGETGPWNEIQSVVVP